MRALIRRARVRSRQASLLATLPPGGGAAGGEFRLDVGIGDVRPRIGQSLKDLGSKPGVMFRVGRHQFEGQRASKKDRARWER